MPTKTIKIKNAVKLEYYDNQRLYLVMAIDTRTGEEKPLFNLNDDKILAAAEMKFDGYLDPIFYPLDDYLTQLHEKENDPTKAI